MNTWGSESTTPFVLNRDTRWVSAPLHAHACMFTSKNRVPGPNEQNSSNGATLCISSSSSGTLNEADGHALAAILRHTRSWWLFFTALERQMCSCYLSTNRGVMWNAFSPLYNTRNIYGPTKGQMPHSVWTINLAWFYFCWKKITRLLVLSESIFFVDCPHK